MTDLQKPHRRRRPLTDDDIELWLHVTRDVSRLEGRTLPELSKPKAPPEPEPPRPATPPQPARPAAPARPAPTPMAPLERRVRQRLARGQMRIEAAIDLHGLRQAEAHSALLAFLGRAQAQGEKLVLVVTGKGRTAGFDESGFGLEAGVLRRAVPIWLRAPELRRMIVGFEPAAAPHGGEGALYVRLRRADRGLTFR